MLWRILRLCWALLWHYLKLFPEQVDFHFLFRFPVLLELSDVWSSLGSEVHFTCGWERPFGSVTSAGRWGWVLGHPVAVSSVSFTLHILRMTWDGTLRNRLLSSYPVTLLLVVLVHEPGLVEVAHGALLVVVCNLALMREPPPQNCTSVWCISNVHDVSRGREPQWLLPCAQS